MASYWCRGEHLIPSTAELLTASVPRSSSLPPVKDDDGEDQVVEGVPAEEEGRRHQRCFFNLWTRLWPFCTTAKRASRSKLKDHQWPARAASTGVQEQLQPRRRRHLRRLPPGVGLQRADVSQEHEGVALGSIQGEAEGAQEPSHTRQRCRDRGIGERGHTVTWRKEQEVIKDCFKKMLGKKTQKDLSTWRCFIPFRHTERSAVCWWWWRWQGAFDFLAQHCRNIIMCDMKYW